VTLTVEFTSKNSADEDRVTDDVHTRVSTVNDEFTILNSENENNSAEGRGLIVTLITDSDDELELTNDEQGDLIDGRANDKWCRYVGVVVVMNPYSTIPLSLTVTKGGVSSSEKIVQFSLGGVGRNSNASRSHVSPSTRM
jgi:hypothetical protein